jgi:hypothetical protein
LAVVIRGEFTGRVGSITAITGDSAELQLHEFVDPPRFIDILQTEEQQWITLADFFDKLGIDHDSGDIFLSSLRVKFKADGSHPEQFVDFAFTAFSQDRVLDGCCRKRCRGYEVTKRFLAGCQSYLQSPVVGNLYRILKNPLEQETLRVTADMLYGRTGGANILRDLNNYIENNLLARRFFLIDEGICHVSQETLEKMEDLVLPITGTAKKTNEKVTVPIADLVWDGKTKPISNAKGKIGDRVINIASVGSIGFGEAGTVVATFHESNMYTVMLDRSQSKATTLRGRLRSKRGYIAMADDLFFVDQH